MFPDSFGSGIRVAYEAESSIDFAYKDWFLHNLQQTDIAGGLDSMPAVGLVKVAVKLIKSGLLFSFGTALFAAALYFTTVYFFSQPYLRGQQTVLTMLLVWLRFHFLVGLGIWCAYLGIRGILTTGRVPREDGEAT
jgi:hypothetical protein